jgi:hypothetical protein
MILHVLLLDGKSPSVLKGDFPSKCIEKTNNATHQQKTNKNMQVQRKPTIVSVCCVSHFVMQGDFPSRKTPPAKHVKPANSTNNCNTTSNTSDQKCGASF